MSRKRILIVDDDRDQQQAVAIRLRAAQYDVLLAADGMQAVAVVRKQKPDLVLLDIGLPGGDGHSVLSRLKAMSPTALLPIIVLSAKEPVAHQERALAEGAEAYFQKPANNDELMAAIRTALGEAAGEARAA